MKRCKKCGEWFETMNYKNEYCPKCYNEMCKNAVEKMKEIEQVKDETNKELEHILTICEILIKGIKKAYDWCSVNMVVNPECENLICNVEIIQDITKKLKTPYN